MHKTIRAHFAALQRAVRSTTIPADSKDIITSSIEKLSTLYGHYRDTNESRYGDEITRLVQSVLKQLEACPEARKLDADFRVGLGRLHEELGIPGLPLKTAKAPPNASKVRKK